MTNTIKTILTVIGLVAAGSLLWFQNRPVTLAPVTPDDVAREAERGGYQLIDVQGLRSLYEGDSLDLLLVDTRQDWEFRAGRIEGSVLFPMEPTWWARFTAGDELVSLLGKEATFVFY